MIILYNTFTYWLLTVTCLRVKTSYIPLMLYITPFWKSLTKLWFVERKRPRIIFMTSCYFLWIDFELELFWYNKQFMAWWFWRFIHYWKNIFPLGIALGEYGFPWQNKLIFVTPSLSCLKCVIYILVFHLITLKSIACSDVLSFFRFTCLQ